MFNAIMGITRPAPPTPSLSTASLTSSPVSAQPCCPTCGSSLPPPYTDTHSALLASQKKIQDLQAQVDLLAKKATEAADRWADYEDEIARLRAASNSDLGSGSSNSNKSPHNTNNKHGDALPTPASSIPSSSPRGSILRSSAVGRISQMLSPRKSAPNLASRMSQTRGSLSSPHLPLLSPASPAPSTDDLLEALSREQSLRRAAEGKLDDTSREVEELSVSLFEQANSMVATERRARAGLEERVGVLERRDEEKRGRLEKLERAMGRIERVSVMLGSAG